MQYMSTVCVSVCAKCVSLMHLAPYVGLLYQRTDTSVYKPSITQSQVGPHGHCRVTGLILLSQPTMITFSGKQSHTYEIDQNALGRAQAALVHHHLSQYEDLTGDIQACYD